MASRTKPPGPNPETRGQNRSRNPASLISPFLPRVAGPGHCGAGRTHRWQTCRPVILVALETPVTLTVGCMVRRQGGGRPPWWRGSVSAPVRRGSVKPRVATEHSKRGGREEPSLVFHFTGTNLRHVWLPCRAARVQRAMPFSPGLVEGANMSPFSCS